MATDMVRIRMAGCGRHTFGGADPVCRTQTRRSALRRSQASLLGIYFSMMLSGCETIAGPATTAAQEALASSSIGRPAGKRHSGHPHAIAIQLNGAPDMNSDENGNGLATVVRIYQLRDSAAFLSSPHAAFFDPEFERHKLGTALPEARELTLLPGQTLHFREVMMEDAGYLGIVAFFRKRSGQRWRFAFASAEAARNTIVVGVHACAMTATGATPLGTNAQNALLLSAAPCKQFDLSTTQTRP